MTVETVEDLFRYELSSALDTERRHVPMLEQLMVDVDDQKLRSALEAHARQTRKQAERIQRCFELLHSQPFDVMSHLVEALERDRDEFHREETGGWIVLTPYSLGLVEKTEQLEVGMYTGLSRQAQSLDHRVCLHLLEETLWEEEQMARRLDRIGRRLLGITQTAGTSG